MKSKKNEGELYVNNISSPTDIKAVFNSPVGNAEKDIFCVYAHKRHAIGSKIINNNGSQSICSTENQGSWQNSK